MKYIKKIPPADKELSSKLISEGWRKLKEPSSLGKSNLFSIPFMFINGVISVLIAYALYSPMKEILNSQQVRLSINVDLRALIYIAIIYIYMAIHELLHACFAPNFLKSDKTYWGINGFNGFVLTTEKI